MCKVKAKGQIKLLHPGAGPLNAHLFGDAGFGAGVNKIGARSLKASAPGSGFLGRPCYVVLH